MRHAYIDDYCNLFYSW